MAKKTNWKSSSGKELYRINRKVGMKLNEDGLWVDDYKCFYGSCKSEAEKKYSEYMSTIKNNTSITKKCLGELIDEWIEAVLKQSELKNSTITKYIRAYEKIFRESVVAGRTPDKVTPLDIQNIYNSCECCYSSIRAAHNLLVRFFKYAELNGICRNITTSLVVPKQPAAKAEFEEIDVWDDDSLKQVINELDGNTLRFMVVLAVNTGARFSELLALTYDDIKGNMLYINKQLSEISSVKSGEGKMHIESTKSTSSNRIIPLSSAVMEELKKHKALQKEEMKKHGYITNLLFTTSNGTFYYKRNVGRSLHRLYDRIGCEHHPFHSFRHTFATNLSRAGVPIEETSKLMGHADISMTLKYYVFVNAERRLSAVEKIAEYSLGA